MDLNNLIKSLHVLERKTLPFISSNTDFEDLVKLSCLKDVEVMRAVQWLENKNIIESFAEEKTEIFLDSNGKKYKQDSLPERKIINILSKGSFFVGDIEKKTGLSSQEISVSIGSLKSLALLDVEKVDGKILLSLSNNGKSFTEKKLLEEKFLENVFPLDEKDLKPEDLFVVERLKKRKNILKVENVKVKNFSLTDLGKRILSSVDLLKLELLDSVTPELLRSGAWKDKEFRRFDVSVNVPKISGGRKQWYKVFLDSVRNKLIGLGFEEMQGPIVESDFWCMDALFMPQFHSARDIHDAFYVKEPEFAELNEKLVEKVKEVHETGGNTGSSGWNYFFDVKRTHKQMLRSQTTACSARKLASNDLKIPGKYFAIAPCFRRDVVDSTHLNNFFQVEGFIIEENLTLRHLFGILKMFADEIAGSSNFRIMPGYFPFTEPSASLLVKHEEMGWIELGGAGIFRPELVIPLTGKNITVIAWGLGIDRLAMFKHNVNDIRTVFTHDLKYLREVKLL
jgi:phenylalanyl-tRNA synthetase alpha chain